MSLEYYSNRHKEVYDAYKSGGLQNAFAPARKLLQDPSLPLFFQGHLHLLLTVDLSSKYFMHARKAVAIFEFLLRCAVEIDSNMVDTLETKIRRGRRALERAEKALQREQRESMQEINQGGVDAGKLAEKLRTVQVIQNTEEPEAATDNEQAAPRSEEDRRPAT